MIKVPNTYAEWTVVLNALKNKDDDEAVMEALQKGTIEWQSGIAERFSKRLIEAVNARMNAASDKFQKDFSRSNGQDGAIVQSLLSLRKEMAFLSKAVAPSVLPEKDRSHYVQLVQEQADNMQKSLEDSAKKDRTGKLISLVRNHKVNAL